MKSHKTFIETVGTKAHPRYRIMDRERGTWDGHDWDTTRKKNLLFYTFQDAAQCLSEIQFVEDFDKPQTTYRATVEVCVAGDNQMDRDELRDYLAKATKLLLTEPPPNDETVQVQVNWDKLQPISKQKGLP